MRYITYPNGTIQFPRRGKPPMVLPGYTVDPGDPYTFFPIYPECTQRGTKLFATPCCPDGKEFTYCHKFQYISVTFNQCQTCVANNQHEPPKTETL